MRLLHVEADIISELRASICHFHIADLELLPSVPGDLDSPIAAILIHRKRNSLYPHLSYSSKEKKAPPRPSAEDAEVELNASFFNRTNATVESINS